MFKILYSYVGWRDVVPALGSFHIVKQVWKRKARKQKEKQKQSKLAHALAVLRISTL